MPTIFYDFIKVYLIGTLASLVPYTLFGLYFGAPSVLIASIITTFYIARIREKYEGKK